MKKRIVLGDPHGRYGYVKDIYDYEKPDEVIVLGDYFDSWDIQPLHQFESFKSLLDLQESHNGLFVLLLGNHDVHYLPDWPGRCSGFGLETQGYAEPALREAIAAGHLRMVYIDSGTIYSHAGITQTWADTWISGDPTGLDTALWSPEAFRFVGADWFGDDPRNSPVWVRPGSLASDPLVNKETGEPWTQVFGHTSSISPWHVSFGKSELWCIDCIDKFYMRETIYPDARIEREIVDTISHGTIKI